MKPLSLTVQKLQRMLKLTTDKQTDKQARQKQYASDHSIRGHKKVVSPGEYNKCHSFLSM